MVYIFLIILSHNIFPCFELKFKRNRVEENYLNFFYFREENSFGKYTYLLEKSKEGKVYRIAIPDESYGQFLQSIENLKPFLLEKTDNVDLH